MVNTNNTAAGSGIIECWMEAVMSGRVEGGYGVWRGEHNMGEDGGMETGREGRDQLVLVEERVAIAGSESPATDIPVAGQSTVAVENQTYHDDNDDLSDQSTHGCNEDVQHQSNHDDNGDQIQSDEPEHDELLDEQVVHVIHRPDSSPVPTSCPDIDELEDISQAIELSSDRASPAVSESAGREDRHSEETPTIPMGYGLQSKTPALSAAPEATPASQSKRQTRSGTQPLGNITNSHKSPLPSSRTKTAGSTSSGVPSRSKSQLLATQGKRASFVKAESRVSQLCLDPFGASERSKRKSDVAVEPSIRKAASRGRPRKIKETTIEAVARPAAVTESSNGRRGRERTLEEKRLMTAKARAALAEKWKLKREEQERRALSTKQEEGGVEEGGGEYEGGAGLQRAASEFGDLSTEAMEELLEAVEAVEARHSSEGSSVIGDAAEEIRETVAATMQTAQSSSERSQVFESSMISSARKASDITTQTESTAPGSPGPFVPFGSRQIPISSTLTKAPGELTPAVASTPLSTSNHGAIQHVMQPPIRIDESSDTTERVRSEITSQPAPQPSTPGGVVVNSGQPGQLPAPVTTRAQAETRSQSTAQISVRRIDSHLHSRQMPSTSAPSRSFIRNISAPNFVRPDTTELASPLPDLSLYTLLDAANFLPQAGSKSIIKGKKRAIDVVDVSSGSEEDGDDEMEDGDGESESGRNSDMRARGGDTEDEAYRDLNVAVARLDGEETESYNEDEEDSDTGSERSALRSSQRTSPSKRGRPSQGGEASTRGRGRPRGSGRGRGGKSSGQFSGRTILGFHSSDRQKTPMPIENRQTSYWAENRPTYASLEGQVRRGSTASLTRHQRSSSLSFARASPNISDDRDISPHLSAFASPSTSFSTQQSEYHALPSRHRAQAAPPPTPSPSQLTPQFDEKKVKTLRRMLSEATTMRSVADQMRDSWIEFQNAYGCYTQDHILLGQETSGCQGRIAEHVHFHVGLSSDVHLFAAAMQRVLDDGAGVAPKLRLKGAARRERTDDHGSGC